MSEMTDAYRTACKRHDDTYEAVINVCLHVVQLANILRSEPEEVQIVGIPQAIGISRAGLSFNGQDWPTAAAINNALAEYHQAISAVQTAWLNVQIHGEHHGLSPPPAEPWKAMRMELLNRANHRPR